MANVVILGFIKIVMSHVNSSVLVAGSGNKRWQTQAEGDHLRLRRIRVNEKPNHGFVFACRNLHLRSTDGGSGLLYF